MSTVDLKEVDFCVIKEDYSRFVLNDETVIKAKIVVRKIFVSPINTPEGYPIQTAFDATNVVVAKVPASLRRTPSNEPLNLQIDKGEEIPHLKDDPREQEYITDNHFRITVRPVLTKVFRYRKYDLFGDPVYNVSLQQITNIEKIESTASK
jgi:hypothetical protein